jgi:hypothetical protein
MAKQKNDFSLTRSALKSLWSFIGIAQWEQLLKEHKRPHGFQRVSNTKLRGLCLNPDHHDTSPSYFIDVEKGYAKCYGSSCEAYESDPVRLLSSIMGKTIPETLRFIVNTYKPPFISSKAAEKFEKFQRHQEMKSQIFLASQQLMLQALADMEHPDNAWARPSLEWLINTRKLPADYLYALPVALLPDIHALQSVLIQVYALKKEEWLSIPTIHRGPEPFDHSGNAVKYLADAIKKGLTGAVMFPLHSSPQDICRFKLRSPDVNIGDPKLIYIVDDLQDEQLGLYGLGWGPYAAMLRKHESTREVAITEGEFDALSIMAHCVTHKIEPPIPVLSVGGTGGAKEIEAVLDSVDASKIYMIGDAPDKSGNEVIQTWLKSCTKIPIQVFTGWEDLSPAKDLDEAVNMQSVGIEKVLDTIFNRREDTYTSVWRWLYDLTCPQLDLLKEDDVRGKIDVVSGFSGVINNAIERRQYTDAIAEHYDLNPSLVYREATTKNDTPMGFVVRIAEAILDIMTVVGTQVVGGGRELVLFNRGRETFHTVTLDSERSIIQELAPVTGVLHKFIEEHVGWPPFLEPLDDADPLTYKKNSEAIRSYTKDAILYLARGTMDINAGRKYRQGYYRIERHDGEVVEVVVCGTSVFHLIRDGVDVQYELLPGPVYKDIIFDVGFTNSADTRPWFPGGLNVPMLNKASKMDLKRLYLDLVKVYTEGWSFKDHDITCQMLAASVMCFPIMDAFFRPIVLFLTGDSNSGKTSFVSSISPIGYAGLRLLWCSQGNDGYTAAATARNMDGDSRLMVLDEFERNDDSKGAHIQAILSMTRGLVSGHATRVLSNMGGTSSTGAGSTTTDQYFRLPVVFAGIQGAEQLQDLNRLLIVTTQRKLFHTNPQQSVYAAFTIERLDEMQVELNAGIYAYADDLRTISEDLRKNYHKMCIRLNVQAEERWATGLMPALAVMKLIGLDYEAFFQAYVEAHKYTIKRVETTTESHAALTSIMHNACIKQVDGPNISLAQLLVIPERRSEVNSANKGVFYDPETQQILFLASTVYNLLPPHMRRSLATAQHVRTVLERHDSAIKPTSIEESGILKRIVSKMGANITLNDVIVLDAMSWLQAAKENRITAEDGVKNVGQAKLDGPASKSPTLTAVAESDAGSRTADGLIDGATLGDAWGGDDDSDA